MNPSTKIKKIQSVLNIAPHEYNDLLVDGLWGPKTQAALDELLGRKIGKGSWFSQFQGQHSWVDHGDRPGSNALGVPDDQQGIALYSPETLGKWFMVKSPDGGYQKLQQTDIGPHPDTGRKIDIAAVAAERFGYAPNNFPTDGVFTWWPV